MQTERTGTRKSWNASWPYPGPPANTTLTFARTKDNLHISSGHDFQKLGKRGTGNIGGNFWTTKRELNESSNSHDWDVFGAHGSHFTGGQYASFESLDFNTFPIVLPSSAFTLNALGSTAIARVLPTNPLSGLTVALGEMRREGIPSLIGIQAWRDRALRAKSAGGEYLNVQFGWIPLINDLKKFSHVVRNQDKLVQQYERNSGSRIKRRLVLPGETSVSTTTGPKYPTPPLTGSLASNYAGQGVRTITTTSSTKRWFSGCFSYHLPPYKANGDNLRRNEQLANYLYGTRITPDTLWNLAPWSWAADWVSNAGDVIHNISAFQQDGLAMPYAYIMEEKSVKVHASLTQKYGGLSASKGTQTFSQTLTTTSKYRTGATPYGFGLNTSSFTTRQWSILAALGLSRGSGQMYE